LAGCGSDKSINDSNSTIVEKEENIYYIEYYKSGKFIWIPFGGIHALGYIIKPDLTNNPISIYDINKQESVDINYSWGYRYKIQGHFQEDLVDGTVFNLDRLISKEKYFKPFTLNLLTHTDIHTIIYENNETVKVGGEPLIEKLSPNTYLAYNELEFKVYYQDLQESLDLRIENNTTITLTFNFEDNGTIFLERIEE